MRKFGSLYVVATPIGNLKDVTLRALEVLQTVDAVVCEELRIGSTLLRKLKLPEKELVALNEHNEALQSSEVLTRLATGQSLALISDCGTPVFSDPGHTLIRMVTEAGFAVIPIPGASSLMAALSVLDVQLTNFFFGGFLPRDPVQRRARLTQLRNMRVPLVLMDTPYRMGALLGDVAEVFGKGQRVTLALDLTQPGETILRGGADEVMKKVTNRKGEFILVVHIPSRSG